MTRIVILLALLSLLPACKLRIEVGEGGYVVTQSGRYECRAGVAAQGSLQQHKSLYRGGRVSAQHAGEDDAGYHCDIDVSDTNFEETFVAVAEPGYRFSHWNKRERGFFGNRTEDSITLTTTGFAGTSLEALLSMPDEIFYVEPVFESLIPPGGSVDCSAFTSSFERIQTLVFDNYGCTNSACHGGGTAAGELDLRADVAYQNLFRVDASASLSEPLQRVYPGEQKFSLLYLKLDAATNGTALPAGGGSPMPIAGVPLSAEHLEAMRLWIRNGAPEDTDVDGVASLLGCDSPTPATANKIDPPEPPPLGEGVQFISGPWTVPPHSEGEVCYATYYDLARTPGLLPESAKVPCEGGPYEDYDGECFASNARTLTQDPQSHHSIISVYTGSASPLDPGWGQWQCLNGPSTGASCDPTRIGEPVASGGADCGGPQYVCGTVARSSIACRGWGASDSDLKQVSMGGAQSPIAAQSYADGVYSVLPARGVIMWNSHGFNLSDQPTTIEQYNNFVYAPQDQRRYLSRAIFDAKDIFVARVPPYQRRTYCAVHTLPVGTRLTQLSSHAHKRGVLWQTWLPPQDPTCTPRMNCLPNETTPDYVSRIYNDPLYLDYDPPIALDSADPADRTLKFCVTYDNGLEYPDLLKRNSTSVGSTCQNRAYCAGGPLQGDFCGSDDSACGDGGACDACIVNGGFTTEDEMFLMLGNYYILPESER
jgi:hypothetical protein